MQSRRVSGILLHPTSLPGQYGIGELGDAAYRFIDFLADCAQHIWQIMPLGPTGYGDSPYASFSAFAGNPLLISLDTLVQQGLLMPEDLTPRPDFTSQRVDYGQVINYKFPLLKKSYHYFQQNGASKLQSEFKKFCTETSAWLDDFSLFMALKEAHAGRAWTEWDWEIATRQPEALQRYRRRLETAIMAQKFYQFLFFQQWFELKKYANQHDLQIMGDVPIFMAHDSADVWSHPEIFYLDKNGYPTVVAGVPPDYFSRTGQLWGNPLYRWDVLAKNDYFWWIQRIRATLKMVDIIRLDHFRGFEAYWEVPATETTAINGRWIKGPGAALFRAIQRALGDLLPIVAEDLGVITPEVESLRDKLDFPGMRVLQFAFSSDAQNRDLPHNYNPNCVVYSGTHDNDTAVAWYTRSGTPYEQDHFRRYVGRDGQDVAWDLIRLGLSSVANMAIFPLQDIFSLGAEARMNYPSTSSGNWVWRFTPEMLREDIKNRLLEMVHLYGRTES
ncbi:4-alpha-glucanotransferase [candidate division KSB1 bacterium]|nr:4-alpha-glucanotransferase [candidate division KSB1 bacterium]